MVPTMVTLAVLFATGVAAPSTQTAVTTRELADYELTDAVFAKFAHATRLIMAATHGDPRFDAAPLFTREISVVGDAPAMAAALEKRLDTEPVLSSALFAADLSAREYAKFALGLFAARLAHGFVQSGALRGVPDGAARQNVAFVERHHQQVSSLLKHIGVQ